MCFVTSIANAASSAVIGTSGTTLFDTASTAGGAGHITGTALTSVLFIPASSWKGSVDGSSLATVTYAGIFAD